MCQVCPLGRSLWHRPGVGGESRRWGRRGTCQQGRDGAGPVQTAFRARAPRQAAKTGLTRQEPLHGGQVQGGHRPSHQEMPSTAGLLCSRAGPVAPRAPLASCSPDPAWGLRDCGLRPVRGQGPAPPCALLQGPPPTEAGRGSHKDRSLGRRLTLSTPFTASRAAGGAAPRAVPVLVPDTGVGAQGVGAQGVGASTDLPLSGRQEASDLSSVWGCAADTPTVQALHWGGPGAGSWQGEEGGGSRQLCLPTRGYPGRPPSAPGGRQQSSPWPGHCRGPAAPEA